MDSRIKILGIDIGSFQITAIIAESDGNGDLDVIGIGTERAQGIKKGAVNNIELAAKSIKSALTAAQKVAGTHFDRVIVSVSGAYTKSIESKGYVNLPEHDINIAEIERAMGMANDAADIPLGYEIIHILPYSFKVDNQAGIEDPLGMRGSRLEVQTHIIIAETSPIFNLRKAVNIALGNIDNLVLAGYASAIATLSDDEKELGAAVIDMGGDTCNLVVHSGNSLRFNDFLEVGSNTITYDLSRMLHTPVPKAEEIKLNYYQYIKEKLDVVNVPKIGEDEVDEQISLKVILDIIYARMHETLAVLAKILAESKQEDLAGAGVVITGGMTKLEGIRKIASAIFNKPVRIAKPKPVGGSQASVVDDEMYSCALGLCRYGAGGFTQYEIDSEKQMRHKNDGTLKANLKTAFEPLSTTYKPASTNPSTNEAPYELEAEPHNSIKDIQIIDEAEKGFVSKIWQKITQLF